MMLNPSQASLRSHSSIWSAIILGVPTRARPPIAAGDLGELADRQIVAPGAFDDPLAAALAGVALRDLGQRAVEVEARGVVAERDRQRGDAAVGVHEAVEQRSLLARLGGGLADHDEGAGQDLDVIGVASD